MTQCSILTAWELNRKPPAPTAMSVASNHLDDWQVVILKLLSLNYERGSKGYLRFDFCQYIYL